MCASLVTENKKTRRAGRVGRFLLLCNSETQAGQHSSSCRERLTVLGKRMDNVQLMRSVCAFKSGEHELNMRKIFKVIQDIHVQVKHKNNYHDHPATITTSVTFRG